MRDVDGRHTGALARHGQREEAGAAAELEEPYPLGRRREVLEEEGEYPLLLHALHLGGERHLELRLVARSVGVVEALDLLHLVAPSPAGALRSLWSQPDLLTA